MPYYSVHRGRNPGIYNTWAEARQNVDHFNGAVYKKFINLTEANDFLKYGYKYKEQNKEKIVIPKPKLPYSKLLNIYTDGSSINNHKKQEFRGAGMGIVFDFDFPVELSLEFDCGEKSNNRAELCAIIYAIEYANEKQETDPRYSGFINIYTDSKYSMLCATNLKSWKSNGWKTSSGSPAKNVDLLIKLQNLLDKRKVFFKHIKAHTEGTDKDSRYNARADALAVAAAQKNISK